MIYQFTENIRHYCFYWTIQEQVINFTLVSFS